MTKVEKNILTITGGGHLAVHALMLTFPSLIPIIQNEYKVGLDTLGFVVSISAFMFGLGAVPAGWLDKYFGSRFLIITYLIGSSLSAFFISMSSSFFHMVLGLASMGLFCSIYHPTGLTLISNRINKISTGMAIHGMFGSMGSALGPLIAVVLTGLISWRASYMFFAIFNGLLAVYTFFKIPSRKKMPLLSVEAKKEGKVTNKKALILYFITNSFLGMAYYGFTTFMPLHLSQNTSNFLPFISENFKAGLFPTLVFFAGMIGALIGGKIGNKYDKALSYIVIIIINIPIFFLVGFSSDILLIVSSLLLGIVYFSNQPIGNTLVATYSDSKDRGFIYGLGFFISFGVGSFTAGLSGIIAVNYGVSFVFPVMGILLIPSVIIACLMRASSIKIN